MVGIPGFCAGVRETCGCAAIAGEGADGPHVGDARGDETTAIVHKKACLVSVHSLLVVSCAVYLLSAHGVRAVARGARGRDAIVCVILKADECAGPKTKSSRCMMVAPQKRAYRGNYERTESVTAKQHE